MQSLLPARWYQAGRILSGTETGGEERGKSEAEINTYKRRIPKKRMGQKWR